MSRPYLNNLWRIFLPYRKFLIDVPHCGGEVIAGEEDSDGDALPPHRRPVHDLVLGDRLVLVEGVGSTPRGLPLDYCNLHVFDLDPHQKEIYLAHDHVFQMILGLVILELNVEALLNADLHLDGVVHLWVRGQGVGRDVKLLGHVCQSSDNCHFQEISKIKRGFNFVFPDFSICVTLA